MTMKPLTLLLYERTIPGGQLIGRLEDMGHRVQVLAKPEDLVICAEREKPMLIIADFEPHAEAVGRAVAQLKRSEATSHIPVIALISARNGAAPEAARQACATLMVQDTVILQHLHQFLDQALALD